MQNSLHKHPYIMTIACYVTTVQMFFILVHPSFFTDSLEYFCGSYNLTDIFLALLFFYVESDILKNRAIWYMACFMLKKHTHKYF